MAGEAAEEPAVGPKDLADAAAGAAFAPIDVAITGRRPVPPPEKEPVERALATAKSISLGIASGAIVAAGALLPVAALLLVVYLAWTLIARRLRMPWHQSG
jgi:hypothetical protein